jgi:glycosyltransferase involved in cell wall biosynthesis
LNILIAIHHFPPRFKGGAELRAFRTATVLQERGYQVRVICVERIDTGPAGSLTWQDECYEGIQVHRISLNLISAPDPFRWRYNNPLIKKHLLTWLPEHPPDIFHLIGGYLLSGSTLQAAQQLHIPTVVSLTDFWFLCPRINMLRSDGSVSSLEIDPVRCARCLGEEKRRYRWPGYIAPNLMNWFWSRQTRGIKQIEERRTFLLSVLNQVDVVISPSQFLRNVYTQASFEPKCFIFSRQGYDFPLPETKCGQKTSSPSLRIGYLGQIAWLKGIHVLFQAARCLNGALVNIKVYGDPTPFPTYTRYLNRMVQRDNRLELAGLIDHQELSEVMRNLDVIVVPSLWRENSPNVILEAFAHRTPVIASNMGGMAELVEHEKNGLLFNPGDSLDLARQLQRILDEPGLLTRLQEGISPVKSFDQEMDELEEIYSRLVKPIQ